MKSTALFSALLAALFLVSAPAEAQRDSWVERTKIKGDVRIRHERIDEEGEEDRARMRFRARLGLTAEVTDGVSVIVQLATGGDNPVSTNQTFDDGFSTKDVGIDLAYVRWKITDGLSFYGGKMKNPLYQAGGAPLIWDGDLNPEGFALDYSSGNFFGTAGGFSVEERSSAGDSLLYVVQAGLTFPIGQAANFTAGAGYFAYTDTVGNEPFYNGQAKGNSIDANGNYVYDYENTELFTELSTTLGDWPLKVYAHATRNGDPGDEDTAYAFGAKIGSAKKARDVEFSWTYQDIEADAVIATFNDSDFGGGGTDSEGHLLKAKYALSEKLFLGGSLFVNRVDRFQAAEHDYNRLQLDVELKFD